MKILFQNKIVTKFKETCYKNLYQYPKFFTGFFIPHNFGRGEGKMLMELPIATVFVDEFPTQAKEREGRRSTLPYPLLCD